MLSNNFSDQGGILFCVNSEIDFSSICQHLEKYLKGLNISSFLVCNKFNFNNDFYINIKPSDVLSSATPEFNTLNIHKLLGNNISEKNFLLSEIILSMSCCPISYLFLSFDQFKVSVLFRSNTASAAKKTRIAFDTESAERPFKFWNYSDDYGFLLNDNVCLDEALTATIHPPLEGQHFTFACLRACEYVLLLSLALTLKEVNPKLLLDVEDLWRKKALMSTDFNNAFLCEHGSYDRPLPVKFYVPGDRVWFRNPDEYSSNVTGFEGSWVIYLGSGFFCNFWDHTKPTPLDLKCIEVYHWRHGAQLNSDGELFMNEPHVATCVKSTLINLELKNEIVSKMMNIRFPSGIYADGGFVDASRDQFRAIDKFIISDI